tara:strand:+ start:363 stop:608 length:246 start_codon:yes stop_codon:yes gene_type:complete
MELQVLYLMQDIFLVVEEEQLIQSQVVQVQVELQELGVEDKDLVNQVIQEEDKRLQQEVQILAVEEVVLQIQEYQKQVEVV